MYGGEDVGDHPNRMDRVDPSQLWQMVTILDRER